MFERADFEVELASSKDEMLEELRQIRNGNSSKPDLVVLDFMLADGHGIEILKAIKKNFITRGIPGVRGYQLPESRS
jgi:Response regulator containing CheY-like receiver, AAA-type ATPase, and DNA-binding domains